VVFVKLALSPPLSASAAPLLFHPLNNPMALFISVVFFHTFSVSPVIPMDVFTLALFAPAPQPIFTAAVFAKLTLVF
jgi:hypothetical protein